MCFCVAEASCESPGASLRSSPELRGASDGSAELSGPQKGSGLKELPETAGTPQERNSVLGPCAHSPFHCICRPSCSQCFFLLFFFLPQAAGMIHGRLLCPAYPLQQPSIRICSVSLISALRQTVLFYYLSRLQILILCDSLSYFLSLNTPVSAADASSRSGANVEEGPLSPQSADENTRGSLKGGDDPDAAEKACISGQDEKGEDMRRYLILIFIPI